MMSLAIILKQLFGSKSMYAIANEESLWSKKLTLKGLHKIALNFFKKLDSLVQIILARARFGDLDPNLQRLHRD